MFNKKIKINKRGMPIVRQAFTLVEVIVAMGIFVIIIAGSSGAFASMFKSYKGAKNINENLKNAQFAMNLMGKTFRTSSVKYPVEASANASIIVVYDYSQSLCIKYQFVASPAELRKSTSAATEPTCSNSSLFNTPVAITSGVVTGRFGIVPSSEDAPPADPGTIGEVGKITVSMTITNGMGANASSANLQTTVGLRDYDKTNVGLDVAP